MMEAVEVEEIEVESPNNNTKRLSTRSTLESPPPSPSSSPHRPPSPPTPTSPNCEQPPPPSPTSPTNPSPGQGGRKLPNIKIKKQYSKIFRIKTKPKESSQFY
ncbi:hypothetical protein Pcinc_005839 [Petrolisthes cinctipes]|uniref:Uncharacterized protein n=1 Tax=Petrolisthes cinctipes TaxID=88211 RepID=A0AAE1GEC2_PETCI|nr:hypothetical protein Pcinc_005839 [Petrolisthes cinctipes]